jgi:hypothetical protein
MYAPALLDRAVRTLQSSIRLWFAVLLISAGFVCAIWADSKDQSESDRIDACFKRLGDCNNQCTGLPGLGLDDCYVKCQDAYHLCVGFDPNTVGASKPGQTQPPNATGPNSTPTPTPSRKYPIKGPPHKLGPNPTPTPAPTPRRHPIKGPPHKLGPSPSPTAKPILLAKPKPTPSPKPTPKKSSRSHH